MCVKFHDEENRLEIMGGAIAVHPGEFVKNSGSSSINVGRFI